MEHIQRKFPERFQQIKTLVQINRKFEDICNDYEEISTWFVSHDRTDRRMEEELDRAREIIQDLEEDILKILEQEVD